MFTQVIQNDYFEVFLEPKTLLKSLIVTLEYVTVRILYPNVLQICRRLRYKKWHFVANCDTGVQGIYQYCRNRIPIIAAQYFFTINLGGKKRDLIVLTGSHSFSMDYH